LRRKIFFSQITVKFRQKIPENPVFMRCGAKSYLLMFSPLSLQL
jgi:hypothetical protein